MEVSAGVEFMLGFMRFVVIITMRSEFRVLSRTNDDISDVD